MKNHLSAILYALMALATAAAVKAQNHGCIKLLYYGDQTKLYPRIVLLSPNFSYTTPDSLFTYKIEIDEYGFEKSEDQLRNMDT